MLFLEPDNRKTKTKEIVVQKMSAIVLKSIDEEMIVSRRQFTQAQKKMDDLITKLQEKSNGRKVGEYLQDEEIVSLRQEVKLEEQELSVAMDVVSSSVRRTQHAADIEIENIEKEVKAILIQN